jgi:hypothetical protein
MNSDIERKKREKTFTLITLGLFVGILLLAEIACRVIVEPENKFQWRQEKTVRNTVYRFDPTLGWFPIENHEEWFEGSVRFYTSSNSDGFRDAEHDLENRERPRVAVLGDSFTWGYDVEAKDRWTDILQERLPEIEVFNCGVSGYGTAQNLLLYREKVRKYKPDLVLLLHSGNDRFNNSRPITHGGYAAPYFRLKGKELVLTNVPLQKMTPYLDESTIRSYTYRSHLWDTLQYALFKLRLRFDKDPTDALTVQLAKEVEQDGAKFFVAIRSDDTQLEAALAAAGVRTAMVDEYLREHETPEAPVAFPGQGEHWTPEGNHLVADLLEPLLREEFGLGEVASQPL